MNKKIIAYVGIAIVGLLLVFFIFGGSQKHFNWSESYRIDSKQPYGAYVLFNLLKEHYDDDNFKVLNTPVFNNLSTKNENALYLVVGQNIYLKTADIDTLKRFVESGNSVFVSSKDFPFALANTVIEEECGVINFQDSLTAVMRYGDDVYEYQYVYKNEAVPYFWTYADSLAFCEKDELIAVSYINDKVSLFKYEYGEGAFYFHTTPLVFCNYFMKEKEKLAYVEQLLLDIPNEKLYWDEYSKIPSYEGETRESPLKYILSVPGLKWAWYVILLTTLIYFAFYVKRRQRIIPIMDSNTNSSIEYAETLGYLYYEEQNHKKIADHKWNLYLNFIRNRYHLHTNIEEEELVKKISLKSRIPLEEVQKIFKEYYRLDFKVIINSDDLIAFHHMIESFYSRCK